MTAVWNGTQNDDFLISNNWEGSQSPDGDDVVIDDGTISDQPVLNAVNAVTVQSVSVSAGRLTVNGSMTSTSFLSTITGTGRMVVGTTGEFVGNVSTSGNGQLDVAGVLAGNVTNNGTLEASGTLDGNVTSSGSLTLNEGASITGELMVTGGTAIVGVNTEIESSAIVVGGSLSSAGAIGGSVTVGPFALFINSGTVLGDVNFTNEGDNFLNTGAVGGKVELGGGADAYDGWGASANILVLGGDGDDSLTGGSGNDRLYGGKNDDELLGGTGADKLYGQGDNDTILGMAGNDLLSGGAGNDLLAGGANRDRLDGGTGTDTLAGGNGADSFIFTTGFGRDTITDFERVRDGLSLDEDIWGGGLSAADIVSGFASVTAAGVAFDFGAGNVLLLQGLTTTAGLAGAIDLF